MHAVLQQNICSHFHLKRGKKELASVKDSVSNMCFSNHSYDK